MVRLAARAVLSIVCVVAAARQAEATTITSTFTAGLEGWTAVETTGGTPSHMVAGGNPGGFLYIDNSENLWAYVVAPAAFLGNLSAFNGGSLSFDGNQLTGNGAYSDFNDWGRVIITGASGSASLDFAPGTIPVNQWRTYSAPLTAAAWGVTPAVWSALLANVTDIRFSLEGTFGGETNGFDNPTLQSPTAPNPVPEPASLILVGVGIALLATRHRRARS